MDIIISNSSNDPIYLQIVNQIKAMIMSGELAPGDALPSMRNLAMQRRISLITTKRAYVERERDGFIESYTGKGSFVKASLFAPQAADALPAALRRITFRRSPRPCGTAARCTTAPRCPRRCR